jgi:hypothetical protein
MFCIELTGIETRYSSSVSNELFEDSVRFNKFKDAVETWPVGIDSFRFNTCREYILIDKINHKFDSTWYDIYAVGFDNCEMDDVFPYFSTVGVILFENWPNKKDIPISHFPVTSVLDHRIYDGDLHFIDNSNSQVILRGNSGFTHMGETHGYDHYIDIKPDRSKEIARILIYYTNEGYEMDSTKIISSRRNIVNESYQNGYEVVYSVVESEGIDSTFFYERYKHLGDTLELMKTYTN